MDQTNEQVAPQWTIELCALWSPRADPTQALVDSYLSTGSASSFAGRVVAGSCGIRSDMGAAEVEAFLNMLANERRVSPSNHNQARSAILFLYRDVLAIELPWLNGVTDLIARLLYGTGTGRP